MRRLSPFVALAAAALGFASISACVPGGVASTGPGTVAEQTTLDEKAGIAVETAYTAAAKGAALAIRSGLVSDPATIQRIGQLDRQAYQAVLATRAAYDAGNAASYAQAFTQANTAVRNLIAAF